MTYDFTTIFDMKDKPSTKYRLMKHAKPGVGDDIIPFSIADMDLHYPPQLTQGLKDYLDVMPLGYSDADDEYCDAVVNWMKKRHNWDIDKSWIVNTNGVSMGNCDCIHAFTEKGDGIIILTPVYSPYTDQIISNQRKEVRVPLINNNGKYTIDFDLLQQKAADPANKMIIFCSPHNPVGRVWTKEELEKVGRICLENNVILVCDEIHHDLIMPGSSHTVMANISEEFANNCIIGTAPSKTFNLAGMATSNIIIKNEELRAKVQLEQDRNGFYSLPTLGYKACEIAYNQCGDWLDEFIQLVDHNAKTIEAFFAANIPQIKVSPLEGTYLIWLDFRSLGLSSEALSKLFLECDWFVDEGPMFGHEGDGFARMSIAAPTSYIEAALERLLKGIRQL